MTDIQPITDLAAAGCCPICGQANRCAIEAQRETGQPQPPCWCVTATFSPGLLARVPEAARNKACICAGCVASDSTKG